jgi:hypothetical protein
MSKDSLEVLYRKLCTRLRERIESAERNLASTASIVQKVENTALHGRKAIETIAHMSLVAIEHGLGELGIPKEAKKQWNAETIFSRLERKEIEALPSPSGMSKSNDPRFKAAFLGISERRLSNAKLIEFYRLFHEPMHEDNPYRTADAEAKKLLLLPKFVHAIASLRDFTWIHFIGINGQGFVVDLKNEYGITVVRSVSKIADVPADLVNYIAPVPRPLPNSMSGAQIPDRFRA